MKLTCVLKPIRAISLIVLISLTGSGCSSLNTSEPEPDRSHNGTQPDPVRPFGETERSDVLWTATGGMTILASESPNATSLNQAQNDTERQYLALLANEITALEAALHKAELHQNKDARVKFQYEWLRDDFAKMKAGILAHVNAPRTQPRKVVPLQGDYRQ